jgi:hypothetical protein
MKKKIDISIFGGFDDLLDGVRSLSLKTQKDLAEDVLRRLYEQGWEVALDHDYSLIVTKTEVL